MSERRPAPPQTAPDAPGGRGAAGTGIMDLRCDVATGTLSTARDHVHIGQRGARILALLMARPDTIVPHTALIEAGWPGYMVEESSLLVEIASLRDALHRLLGEAAGILGIARQGYRLATAATGPRLPGRWELPAIGILPVIADAPGDQVRAEALTATVTATLSMHAGLSIAPAHVTSLIAGSHGDSAAKLDLRYLLQARLSGAADRPRVSLTLTRIADGRGLWTADFDQSAPLTEEAMRHLAAELMQTLDILLVRGEEAAIGYPPTRNLAAWSHYIRGLGHAYWPRHDMLWTKEVKLALAEWERALELDPDHAALSATMGAGHAVLAAYPVTNDFAFHAAEAARHLQAALDRDPDHPVALAFHAMMLSEQDRFEVAAEVAHRTIRLAPHAPAVVAVAAVALCAAGQSEAAVQAVERTLAVSPHFPSIFTPPLARAWRSAGHVNAAIGLLEALNEEPHKFDGRELILAYAQAGRHEDAVNVATQLLLLEPGFTITGWLATQHRADPAAIARDAAALRSVGLPE